MSPSLNGLLGQIFVGNVVQGSCCKKFRRKIILIFPVRMSDFIKIHNKNLVEQVISLVKFEETAKIIFFFKKICKNKLFDVVFDAESNESKIRSLASLRGKKKIVFCAK